MSIVNLEDCCEILDSKRIPITAANRTAGKYPYYGANGVQDYVADYIFDDELVLLAEDGGNFNSATKPIAYRVSGKCWVNNHAHVLKPLPNINVDYLCYSLMFYKVGSLVNGATREKLTQAAMRKMKIYLRPMVEQIAIVSTLSKTKRIIEHRRAQLAKLDELVKCRFVELFIGKGYPRRELQTLIQEGTSISYGIVQPGDDGTGNIGLLRPVDFHNGAVILDNLKYIGEAISNLSRKTILEGNELLITVRGTTGLTALTNSNHRGMNVTRGIAVVRYDGSKIVPEYLQAFMDSDESQTFISEHTRGATLQQINLSDLRSQLILVPPYGEQQSFAAFVRRIDKLRFVE